MRGNTTANLVGCVGLKETLAANRLTGQQNDNLLLNEYAGKNFYHGENYRAAVERLDGGYNVAMDLIEWMQDFCDNEQNYADRLISYTEKWNSRLKQQSSLVSYNTTKRAQLDCVRVSKEIAALKRTNCQKIQQVIDNYRQYVNQTFIVERFRPVRRHNQTMEIKKSFKSAQDSLRQLNDELKTLSNQIQRTRETVRAAESACEILDLDPTVTKKQRQRAADTLENKRSTLENLEKKNDRTKEKQRTAEKTYRFQATEIFKQCQHFEEERLDQIRETLLDFIQASHPENFSNELDRIFQRLNEKVTTNQNSFDDLIYWAKTYGIDDQMSMNDDSTDSDEDSSTSRSQQKRRIDENLQRKTNVNNNRTRKTRTNVNSERKTSAHCDSLLNQV